MLLYLSVIILNIFVILDSVEILMNRKLYGFISPISINKYDIPKYYRNHNLINFIYSSKWLILLTTCRLITSFLIIFLFDNYETLFLFLALIGIEIYFRLRFINRLSAADHIYIFNLICIFGYLLTKDKNLLYFISIYLIISYTFNGINKAKSKDWLEGKTLHAILSTEIYGNSFLSTIITNERIYKIVIFLIILFQISFVLFLVNYYFAWIYLVIGILFHLMVAFSMKLRDFLFAFLSSYPILVITYIDFHEYVKFWNC